ncbi:P-loop containing nucleoside triphosphate hydrolase protein [Fistulina hepatica ATCC 64428]|uniref:p-loop containing nucleoside triphosphate hydrolase protein n=1 Tax=Fistulina hepatica ATCC 64428 TaxID=1128425 RepID=A0A0D7A3P5_9AGAR|nr:P-loop containing nucleoside triphosphate hydrolase protein [Fistulina hepatica ATCC 64428]
MYHLLRGLREYLERKDEFSVIIIGLDGAGKTTLLEQIKKMYTNEPSLDFDQIHPTVGQNTGTITLSSSVLQFWDLGGQKGIRTIWPRYYDDCHAVVYVIDGEDRDRLNEGWEVFDSVFSAPEILNLPLLLLVNKQDSPFSMSVAEVRHDYERWYQRNLNPHHAERSGQEQAAAQNDASGQTQQTVRLQEGVRTKRERFASMDIMGISAKTGMGVKAAVDWLFIRVQNSRP